MQMNSIIRGDNLDQMRELARSETRFDLILTDPPYNVGKNFGNDTDRQSTKGFIAFFNDRAMCMQPLLNPKASLICFASQRYVARQQLVLETYELFFQRMMIWHYKNGMSRQSNSPVTEFEPILWHTRDPEAWTYNADDVRVPYKSERVKNPVYKTNKSGERVAWTPNPLGAKRGDVWEYPCLAGALYKNERTEHPTQKPEALIMDLLKAFCPKGEDGMYEGNVFDPFIGSGTTAVCCERLNQQGHRIQWMGVELEEKWVDVANRRLADLREHQSIL